MARLFPCLAQIQQQLSIASKYLQVIKIGIDDVHMPKRVDSDTFRPAEAAGRVSELANLAGELSLRIENLHPSIERIGYVKTAFRIQSEVGGEIELAISGAPAPKFRHEAARKVEPDDAMALRIRHPQRVRRYDDARRALQMIGDGEQQLAGEVECDDAKRRVGHITRSITRNHGYW